MECATGTGTTLSYRDACEAKVTPQLIFSSYLKGRGIITRPDLLSASFVPETVLHRDSEIRALSAALAPALKGFKPNNVFIYGTVGTGKTITVRYVLNELSKAAAATKQPVKTIYINCKMKHTTDTEYRLLVALLREFGVVAPETGLSTSCLYRKFSDVVKNRIVIIALDEIDSLVRKSGDEFLYNLSRADAKISLIGITNNLMWRNELDIRVKSSLAEEELTFNPYNAAQLADILRARAKAAFSIDVDDVVINKCAALAAQEHGDARRALELLRTAAEVAERAGAEEIFEEHIDIAEQRVDHDRLTDALKGQPKQSLAVLSAIFELCCNDKGGKWNDNRIFSGDVYTRYKALCGRCGLKVLTQRRVSDLMNELEAIGVIETKVMSKGRHGRMREITVCLDESGRFKVQRVLAEAGV
ncbi:MAG: AAA family ATPase [Candidatus Aenigmatarchaeota archaeon]